VGQPDACRLAAACGEYRLSMPTQRRASRSRHAASRVSGVCLSLAIPSPRPPPPASSPPLPLGASGVCRFPASSPPLPLGASGVCLFPASLSRSVILCTHASEDPYVWRPSTSGEPLHT
jgi:hypothetical protein